MFRGFFVFSLHTSSSFVPFFFLELVFVIQFFKETSIRSAAYREMFHFFGGGLRVALGFVVGRRNGGEYLGGFRAERSGGFW